MVSDDWIPLSIAISCSGTSAYDNGNEVLDALYLYFQICKL